MTTPYLTRKADAFLAQWKANPNRLPLIVKGPRQVGKTRTIRRFAADAYDSVIEINFIEQPRYRAIMADGYDTGSIIRNISLIDPSKRFIPSRTLLFFDEIQAAPDIATSLKFFKQDGRTQRSGGRRQGARSARPRCTDTSSMTCRSARATTGGQDSKRWRTTTTCFTARTKGSLSPSAGR